MTEFHNSHQEPFMNTVASYCSAHKESRKDVHTHILWQAKGVNNRQEKRRK